MVLDGEILINDQRYEDIIRIGYESAKKNIEGFEAKFSCCISDLTADARSELTTEELTDWRISFMVVNTLEDKIN